MSAQSDELVSSSSVSDNDPSAPPMSSSWTHRHMWEEIVVVLGQCRKNKALVVRFHTAFWHQLSHDQRDMLVEQWRFRANLGACGGKQRALGYLRMLMPRAGMLLCMCVQDVIKESVLSTMMNRAADRACRAPALEGTTVHRHLAETSQKRKTPEGGVEHRAICEA